MVEPTRRSLLRGAPALLGAIAGCDALGESDPTETTTTIDQNASVQAAAPERRLVLVNDSGEDQFVSVAVRRDGDVISSSTVEVPLQTRRTFSLPAPASVLDVELETTTGLSDSHPWVVGEHMRDLTITLTSDDITFSQRAWCSPDCVPLSKGGTTVDFPYYGGPADQNSAYGANVVITNTLSRSLTVNLNITHDGDSILDYTYLVPPNVTLEFPGVHSAGDYTVSLQSDVGDLTYDWNPPKERRLEVRLTESGVQVTCGQTSASLLLRNNDTLVHKLDVAAYRPGTDLPSFNEMYIVQPGARYREKAVYTGSGQYELVIKSATGNKTTYDWWLCPPRGPTEITIQQNGKINVVQYQPGE